MWYKLAIEEGDENRRRIGWVFLNSRENIQTFIEAYAEQAQIKFCLYQLMGLEKADIAK